MDKTVVKIVRFDEETRELITNLVETSREYNELLREVTASIREVARIELVSDQGWELEE